MTAILVTILLVGFGIWLTNTLLPVLQVKWKMESDNIKGRNEIRARYAKVAEREIALAEHRNEKPQARYPMPPDIEARVNAWEDEFARSDEQKYVEQLYAELGDWDAVRRAYSPPLADNHPEMQVTG